MKKSLRTATQRRTDKRAAAKYLDIAKKKYDAGNKAVLLKALHECLILRTPLPEWLRDALINAIESAARFEIRSWDDAFGPAQGKGIHLETRKKHSDLRNRIAFRVALREPQEKIGDKDNLFATIAEELKAEGIKGINSSTVRKIYYKRGGKELHEMIDDFRELVAAESPAKSTSTKN